VKSADLIGFIAATCVACAPPMLAQEVVTIKAVPGNPWSYNSELIFKQGAKEIARQRTDTWGNIAPVSGTVPDGLTTGYYPDRKPMMEIPFEHNHAEGVGHSFYESGAIEGDSTYRGGILDGTRTGYYLNGRIKTQGEWRDGKPVHHKLFDEQGHLEMTTDIRKNTSTETRFYPDKRKKSVWTRKGNRVSEASEYGEDGKLRIHATKFATLNECRVSSDKPLYASGDAVGFSLTCRCEEAKGCFSPGVDARGAAVNSGWTKHLVIERDGIQYLPVFCPMSAMMRLNLYSKWLFKDGEQIAHAQYTSKESVNDCDTRWVDRAAYSACSEHLNCISKLYDRSACSLTPGGYTAWLDAATKPAQISFKIEAGK
jgi:antitoxin component YwqK of YwqJK toxin-antitoxin module